MYTSLFIILIKLINIKLNNVMTDRAIVRVIEEIIYWLLHRTQKELYIKAMILCMAPKQNKFTRLQSFQP